MVTVVINLAVNFREFEAAERLERELKAAETLRNDSGNSVELAGVLSKTFQDVVITQYLQIRNSGILPVNDFDISAELDGVDILSQEEMDVD